MQFFAKFDQAGEYTDLFPYDTTISQARAELLQQEGFELISEETWDKLVGNYDGQRYVKDMQTGRFVPQPEYVPPFQDAKNEKLEAIREWTENRITGGFTYDGVAYDSDLDTQITMQGIALNVHTDEFATRFPEGCPVRGYDQGSDVKTIHYLNADGVLGFCAALSLHIGQCKQEGWDLQSRVYNANTREELDRIILTE